MTRPASLVIDCLNKRFIVRLSLLPARIRARKWRFIVEDSYDRVMRFANDPTNVRIFELRTQEERRSYYEQFQSWYQQQLGADHYSNYDRSVKGKRLFVYLMKDERSGFYKIGYSRDPKHRERTLQAEAPLVELLHAWEGTIDDEQQLHHMFASQRIRGEWFDLAPQDIQLIQQFFQQR